MAKLISRPQPDARYEILADWEAYAYKPVEKYARIRTHLGADKARRFVTVEELAHELARGVTVMFGVCEGGTTTKHWKRQQLFTVDIDNDEQMRKRGYPILDPCDAVNRAYKRDIQPLLLYFTHSATIKPWNPRYRIVFAADEVIKDYTEAQEFAQELCRVYPEADPASMTLTQMYLGSNGEVWPMWEATNDVDERSDGA